MPAGRHALLPMARTKALTCYGMSYRGACSLLLVIAQAARVGWCDIHPNARPLVRAITSRMQRAGTIWNAALNISGLEELFHC